METIAARRAPCVFFLFVAVLLVSDPGSQGRNLDRVPLTAGALETRPRSYERETAQVGGAGSYHYRTVGSLRCGRGDAVIGAKVSGKLILTTLRIRCAPVKCDEIGCGWSDSSAYDGPVVGNSAAPTSLLQCPKDRIVAGYTASVVRDAVGADLTFDCRPIAGTSRTVGSGDQIYPVAAALSSPSGLNQLGGAAVGSAVAASLAYQDTIQLSMKNYVTADQRGRYYDAIDVILSHGPLTADIRFFGAGCPRDDRCYDTLAAPAAVPALSIPAQRLLEFIGNALFERNMRVIRDIVQAGIPVDPAAKADAPVAQTPASSPNRTSCTNFGATAISIAAVSSGTIQALSLYCGSAAAPKQQQLAGGCPMTKGMVFDLKMVELEQSAVQTILTTDPEVRRILDTSSQLGGNDAWANGTMIDLNNNLDTQITSIGPGIGIVGTIDRRSLDWGKAFLGVKDLDVQLQSHRVAIGSALLFQRHNCTYDDFISAMTTTGEDVGKKAGP